MNEQEIIDDESMLITQQNNGENFPNIDDGDSIMCEQEIIDDESMLITQQIMKEFKKASTSKTSFSFIN